MFRLLGENPPHLPSFKDVDEVVGIRGNIVRLSVALERSVYLIKRDVDEYPLT